MRFVVIVVILVALGAFKGVESSCGCAVPFRQIGCFKDKKNDRALPEQLINERDSSSSVANGHLIDWDNWQNYLPQFICRCAQAAHKKGYKYFGMQFWGECWSGPSPTADQNYAKHGSDDLCYDNLFAPCPNDFKSVDCVGEENHNFVYEIVYSNCDLKFERLGCYNDYSRPIDQLLITDRDPTSSVDSGILIDWFNYDTYLPDFACRCAQKADDEGYNTFGLEYYGECWGGVNASKNYFHDGHSSSGCINPCYKDCQNFNRICMGIAQTIFVYRITKESCEIDYSNVGCYNETKDERALNELIIDDVHPNSPKFTGIFSAHYSNWEIYIKGLICRCARKVKELGYSTFAIYNKGECWSGAYAHNSYDDHGSSSSCHQEDAGTACTEGGPCVGSSDSIYVYELTD